MSDDYPIKEDIVQAVVAALEAVTIAGGYKINVSEVVRPRRTGERFTPADMGVAVIQYDERREPTADLAGNPPVVGWRLPISCCCVVRLSEKDARPMDQVLNIFEAAVRKALMADSQWGGLAVDSELGNSEYPDGADGFEGVTVWIEIIYRVAENDPYVNMA